VVTEGLYDARDHKIYIGTIMAIPDESLTKPKILMGTAHLYNPIITFLYHLPLPFDDVEANSTYGECWVPFSSNYLTVASLPSAAA